VAATCAKTAFPNRFEPLLVHLASLATKKSGFTNIRDLFENTGQV
jgi:hypothetical protein